jgi:Leucine-rich repeat (LRR) protein
LDLGDNDVGRNDVATIASLKFPKSLLILNLGYNNLSSEGLSRLNLPDSVTDLNLEDNYHITYEGVAALSRLRNLRVLNVSGNAIIFDSCRREVDLPQLPYSLRSLDVSNTGLGPEGVPVLCSILPPNLEDLYLNNNHIGPRGALALRLPINLVALNLSQTQLRLSSKEAAVFKLPRNLETLMIGWNDIRRKSIGNLKLPDSLVELHFYGNRFLGDHFVPRWVGFNKEAMNLVKTVKLGAAGPESSSGKFEVLPNEVVCAIILASLLKTVLSLSWVCRRFRDCALSDFVSRGKTNGSGRIHVLFRDFAVAPFRRSQGTKNHQAPDF